MASRSFIFNLDDELSSESYDANGNLISKTDALGRTTSGEIGGHDTY
ncbi:MAG: RHS repeat domain-containing protein [Terracidiphilus sp.]